LILEVYTRLQDTGKWFFDKQIPDLGSVLYLFLLQPPIKSRYWKQLSCFWKRNFQMTLKEYIFSSVTVLMHLKEQQGSTPDGRKTVIL